MRADPDAPEALRLLKEIYLDLGDEEGAARAATSRTSHYFLDQARESLANLELRASFQGPGLTAAAAQLFD